MVLMHACAIFDKVGHLIRAQDEATNAQSFSSIEIVLEGRRSLGSTGRACVLTVHKYVS